MHFASLCGHASTCQLLCALDGVDQNVVNDDGDAALDKAIDVNAVDSVRSLLEFNVDTSKARVTADTKVGIVQLLDKHRKRSVKKTLFFVGIIVLMFVVCRKLNELQFAIECSKNNA